MEQRSPEDALMEWFNSAFKVSEIMATGAYITIPDGTYHFRTIRLMTVCRDEETVQEAASRLSDTLLREWEQWQEMFPKMKGVDLIWRMHFTIDSHVEYETMLTKVAITGRILIPAAEAYVWPYQVGRGTRAELIT